MLYDGSLRSRLLKHYGHNIVVAKYGNPDFPVDVCLECEDCCEVILSSEHEEISDKEEE